VHREEHSAPEIRLTVDGHNGLGMDRMNGKQRRPKRGACRREASQQLSTDAADGMQQQLRSVAGDQPKSPCRSTNSIAAERTIGPAREEIAPVVLLDRREEVGA
jgi:hypothetical protein